MGPGSLTLWWRATATAWLVLFSYTANAHVVSQQAGDFYAGMLHPLTALEHLLPMVALGLLAGQQRLDKGQGVLVALPAAMAVGACLALVLPPLPGVSLINIGSVVLLGGLVAAAWPLPSSLLYGLAVVLGITQGYANGTALTAAATPYLFVPGLVVAALLVLSYSLCGTELVLRLRSLWPRIAVRVAGSWIAAIGILVLSMGGKAIAS